MHVTNFSAAHYFRGWLSLGPAKSLTGVEKNVFFGKTYKSPQRFKRIVEITDIFFEKPVGYV